MQFSSLHEACYKDGNPRPTVTQRHKVASLFGFAAVSSLGLFRKKPHTPGGMALKKPTTSLSEIWLRNHPKGSGFSHFFDTVLPGFQLCNCHLPSRNHNYTIFGCTI